MPDVAFDGWVATLRHQTGWFLNGIPKAQGLYDPRNEHDACGVGFIAHIKGKQSHDIVSQALEILKNIDHRGAVGADPLLGDGAGILLQLPDPLIRQWAESQERDPTSSEAITRWPCTLCQKTRPPEPL